MRNAVQKNAAAYYLLFAITALAGFIVSPILLTYLGATSFGLFKGAQKLMDVASIADGRTGQALKWTIARNISNGDDNILSRAVSNAVHTAVMYSPLLMIIVVALVGLVPALTNSVSPGSEANLRILVAVLGFNLVLMPLLSIPDAVLIGSNRGYISSLIQIFTLIGTNIGLVITAQAGGGIVALGIMMLGGVVINAIFIFAVARFSTPWLRWQRSSGEELKRFVGLSGWMLGWSGVEKILLSGEVLLLMGLIGPLATTNYIFATFAVQLFLAVSLLTVSSATPTIGILMSTSKEQANHLAVALRECILAISICAAALLLIWNKSFIGLWSGEAIYIGNISNLLIALAMLQVAWIRCDAQLSDLTLDISARTKVGLLCTILTILIPISLTLISTPRTELVLLGVLLGRFLLQLLTGRQVRREFVIAHSRPRSWIGGVVILAISYWIGANHNATSWSTLILGVFLSTLLIAPFVILTMTSKCTRKAVLASLRYMKEVKA